MIFPNIYFRQQEKQPENGLLELRFLNDVGLTSTSLVRDAEGGYSWVRKFTNTLSLQVLVVKQDSSEIGKETGGFFPLTRLYFSLSCRLTVASRTQTLWGREMSGAAEGLTH